MLADAKFHNDYNSLSTKHAKALIDTFVPKLVFKEDDIIMDVGCGSGDNTKDTILRRIPKLKKMIGIDVIPEMIEFARLHYADEKIEYHVADIQDRSSLRKWEGTISKIFSVLCFHWVGDQKKGFQNFYYLLRPEGEAVFVFFLSMSLWDCYPSLINNPRWNKYLKDAEGDVPESHHLHLGSDYFKNTFEDLGFEVLVCEEETQIFPAGDEMKGGFKAHSGLTKHIPDELRDDFVDDLYNEHRRRNQNDEGIHTRENRVLTVHLRKS